MLRRTLVSALALGLLAGTSLLAGPSSASEPGLDEPGLFSRTGTSLKVPTSTSGAETPDKARELGADWLVKVQATDGGWGAGTMGVAATAQASDVATTAYAVMALTRSDAGTGRYVQARDRGVAFVVNAIETAPQEGARLNTPQGTQPQGKLGQLVDTHLAAMMLGEVIPLLEGDLRKRANVAYDDVLTRVQRAQQADGSFDGNGWAPVLSTSIAAQTLETAVAQGKAVDEDVLSRAADYQDRLTGDAGTFDASAGAGVQLYAAAGSMRANAQVAKREQGDRGDLAEKKAKVAEEAIVGSMGSGGGGAAMGGIAAGYGSAGGEEMLSYMMISDALAEQGGDAWKKWSDQVNRNLLATQNADGSWVGHHCITSPVFVTAGAVMTLAAEDWAKRKSG